LIAKVAWKSSGVSTPTSLSPKKLRAVDSPLASVIEPTSSTYQGSGDSQLSSVPRPRLPSPPNTRPSANG
jgi:hypothetical protein